MNLHYRNLETSNCPLCEAGYKRQVGLHITDEKTGNVGIMHVDEDKYDAMMVMKKLAPDFNPIEMLMKSGEKVIYVVK